MFPAVPRFFVHPDDLSSNSVTLDRDTKAHVQALRLRLNEEIDLVCDKQFIRRITISKLDKSAIFYSSYHDRPLRAEPKPKVTLIQGVPKADKLSEIINSCSQLGLSKLVLWESERSVSQISPEKWPSKLERWQQVAKSAAMQSHQDRILEIHPALVSTQEIASFSGELKIGFWESESQATLKQVLSGPTTIPESVCIVVGPEGGITEAEIDLIRRGGYHTASLGESILRVEVAAFSAISAIRFWASK